METNMTSLKLISLDVGKGLTDFLLWGLGIGVRV